eukprot:scaffold45794_cov51-Phaeocystis_antarctica.AAC.1
MAAPQPPVGPWTIERLAPSGRSAGPPQPVFSLESPGPAGTKAVRCGMYAAVAPPRRALATYMRLRQRGLRSCVTHVPTRSKAVKSAALEAAGSITRGSGWVPSGLGLLLGVPGCPETPGAP